MIHPDSRSVTTLMGITNWGLMDSKRLMSTGLSKRRFREPYSRWITFLPWLPFVGGR
jgi:hypothetical protein